MARIRATESYRLSNRYGGIYWNYETNKICGVLERAAASESTVRDFYDLTDGVEGKLGELDLSAYSGLSGDSPVRSAQFFSGQIGVLMDQEYEYTIPGVGRYMTMLQVIFWFATAGAAAPGENHFWNGIGAFAVRLEDVNRSFFFQGPAEGNLVRWNVSENTGDINPGVTKQYLPWRSEGGEVRGLNFQDCTGSISINTPSQMLVIGSHGGRVAWMDVSGWDVDALSMKYYKTLGCLEGRDISDIAIDRTNNILYVLDSGNTLLKYELEPFGSEQSGYNNTPQICQLYADTKTISQGGTITIYGVFRDMWDQIIDTEGLAVELISGGNLGSFQSGSTWVKKIQVETNSSGVFSVTYKGNSTGTDEIIARYVE